MESSENNWIHQPEGKTFEIKRDLSSPPSIMKALVAFANTAGGRLIVGIEDDTREILGVNNPLDEEERLCNLIADHIEPRLLPNIELLTVEGKTLLVAEVFPSSSRPHWIKKEGPVQGVYVRLGSTNRQADVDLIQELRRSALGAVFDEQPLGELKPDSLDFQGVAACFSRHRKLVKKDLETLRLVTAYQGRLVPTVGGVLLFGRDREMAFPDAWIQCGRFVGTDKADIFDHVEIHEHLPIALERIMDFLKKHAMRGADFSELRRKDVWSIPLKILREAVTNAVVHADYSQKGAPIRVAFFDDRIEIENPGILLPGLTLEDMRQGVSRLRNRVIARVFRELDLIEQWGSGIRLMFKEAEALGLPDPEIMEIGMKVRVIIRLAKAIPIEAVGLGSRSDSRSESRSDSRSESEAFWRLRPEWRSEWRPESVHDRVMAAIGKIPLGRSEIAEALGHKSITGALRNALSDLMLIGVVEYTLPDKPNSRLQKYRLKGKE